MFFLQFILFSITSVFAYDYGIDRLDQPEVIERLEGRRIAVLAHAASVDREGKHLIDLLHSRYDLKKIFVPEHGLRSLNDGWIDNGIDEKTGLPVLSLYQDKTRAPKPEDLQDVDLVVMDLQDVGVRYYTYFSTIAEFIRIAASMNKEIVLLDRPNPVGGDVVEGETLAPELMGKFIAYYSVPTRHGMTMGELARMFVAETGIPARLKVVEVRGWNREPLLGIADRPWVPSSPALLTLEQVYLYALWGSLEHFNLAVGRGKTNELAFRVIAAPWITKAESADLASELNLLGFKGITFVPFGYQVSREIHLGQKVNGVIVQMGKGYETIRSDEFTFRISSILSRRYRESGKLVFSKYCSLYYGDEKFTDAVKNGLEWNGIRLRIDSALMQFKDRRAAFLLYSAPAL